MDRRKGRAEYQNLLSSSLQENKLGKAERSKLEGIMHKYGLQSEDVREFQRVACSTLFHQIASDQRINEEEKKALEDLMEYFKLEIADFDYNQITFNKCYALQLIDEGKMPNLKIEGMDIAMKKGEIMHWCSPCTLRKKKSVTTGINYSGLTCSIRIMRGLRYRAGSMKFDPIKSEQLVVVDVGHFWLSNQRVGFEGRMKSFSFPYSQIHRLEVLPEGLLFFKQGKETGYLLSLDDYDVPCVMLSAIMNK